MPEKLFIVGDVHGEYQMLEKLLKHWQPDEEELVFLGDLGDRGPDSKSCFLKVFDLVQSGQAVCVTGNHEDMLISWLSDPENRMSHYLGNGAKSTLESFFGPGILERMSPSKIAEQLKQDYPELISFLRQLPLYYENEFCICVHAGLNLDLEDWRQTSRHDCIWLREDFYDSDESLEKRVVFGHTPVTYLRRNASQTQIWSRKNKLNIDGGAAYGGALHGVVLSDKGIEADYQIFSQDYNLN